MAKRKKYDLSKLTVDERYSGTRPCKVIEGVGYSPDVFAANKDIIMAQSERNIEAYGLPLEWQEQAELIKWCRGHEDEYPDLHWIHHSPNGEYREGWTGTKLKLMGVSPGFPDLILCKARGGYHGLLIEMKRVGEETSEEQDKWLAYLTNAGFRTAVCQGWAQGREELLWYMGLPETHVIDGYFLEGGA